MEQRLDTVEKTLNQHTTKINKAAIGKREEIENLQNEIQDLKRRLVDLEEKLDGRQEGKKKSKVVEKLLEISKATGKKVETSTKNAFISAFALYSRFGKLELRLTFQNTTASEALHLGCFCLKRQKRLKIFAKNTLKFVLN
jgi:hypothetical protein